MFARPRLLVVAETPSLARSLADLLETDGFDVALCEDEGREIGRHLHDRTRPVRLVISASNAFTCTTARRWAGPSAPAVDLVVVGSRDPTLRTGPRTHVVNLPLEPDVFLALVRRLLERSSVPAGAAAPSAAASTRRRPGARLATARRTPRDSGRDRRVPPEAGTVADETAPPFGSARS